FFFFFQAEDGIRDYKVTGVQTCALPILNWASHQTNSKNIPEIALQLTRTPLSEVKRTSQFDRAMSAFDPKRTFAERARSISSDKIGRAQSELQSPCNLVCRLLLEKKNKK